MDLPPLPLDSSRRSFLRSVSQGLGAIALAAGVGRAERTAASPLAPKPPHHEPKAKRVLMLCMEGGPSHLDTFDYKPELEKREGRPIGKGRVPRAQLMPSPWSFQPGGESGLWISDLFPELRQQADKLCVIRGMQTDIPAHPPAFIQMHTGISNAPRPSMGAWILYGLGSENENLPGFVTISPPSNFGGPINYGSAFLPAVFQGTRIGRLRQPVATARVNNMRNMRRTSGEQLEQLEYLRELNRLTRDRQEANLYSDGLLEAHELAYRMQGELPQVLDLDRETSETRDLYGLENQESENFGRQCLMARRLLEAGVRFVEVCHGGWDQHRNLEEIHGRNGRATDRPIAGLLEDLERRGLLQDTLVIWGGEFGRTPYAQLSDGRDHNHRGFTTWMAGGGVKGGFSYGATDEFGLEAVENPLHIHDWHATILHLLGLNHERLTYRYAGRDMRLTDVKGRVAKELLA